MSKLFKFFVVVAVASLIVAYATASLASGTAVLSKMDPDIRKGVFILWPVVIIGIVAVKWNETSGPSKTEDSDEPPLSY